MDRITQKDWERIDKLMRLAESNDVNEAKAADQGIFRILCARGISTKDIVEALKKNTIPSKTPDTTYVRVSARDIFGGGQTVSAKEWEDMLTRAMRNSHRTWSRD